MKIKLSGPVRDPFGDPVMVPDEAAPRNANGTLPTVEFTVVRACINALMAKFEREEMSGEEMLKLYETAGAIVKASKESDGILDLGAAQIASLQKRLEKMYAPLIYAPLFKMLETPITEPPAEDKPTAAAG